MARYTGTRGRDEFLGISGQNNRFLFRTDFLDSTDIVIGSFALTDLDTLVLDRPDGTTGPLLIEAGVFDQVRNIEVIRLDDPGIVLTVSQQLAGSSQRGFLTISGSSGDDVVSGQPTDPSSGPVTTPLAFNPNGGADSFTGGEGRDRVTFGDANRTGTTLDGRGGFDTLVYTGTGTFDFVTLADVRRFEGAELRATDGSATLVLDDKPFATSDTGAFTVRSFGSDTIDASRVSAGNTVIAYLREGDDTYIGGPSSANVDGGLGDDTVTLVNGGGQASGGEGLDVANLGLALASPYSSGSIQLKLTDLETRTFDVSFQGSGFAPLAEVGHAVIDGFETLNFTAAISYRPFNYDFATYDFDFSDFGTALIFESISDNNVVRYSISADEKLIVGGIYVQGNYDNYRALGIIATNFADTINEYSGYVSGLGGDDLIIGGAGDNYIDGGAGVNTLDGGNGYDSVEIISRNIAEFNSGINLSVNVISQDEYSYRLINEGIVHTESTAVNFESLFAAGTQYDDLIKIDFDYEYTLPFYSSPAYVRGHDGDDKFIIPYFQITSLNGGAGSDTAIISSANSVITLTNISFLQNEIERIDLGANHGNTLRINEQNVISLSSERDALFTAAPVNDALVVDGDATDTLDLHSTVTGGLWIEEANGVGLDGSAGGDYRFLAYQLNGETTAYIAVDSDVTVLGTRAPLPSILVTTGADEAAQTSDATAESSDGEGLSLRESLSTATADGLIVRFEASLAGQQLLLTNGPLTATTAPVTVQGDINGDGASDITVIADGANPAFVVNGGDLTLSNLTVETQEDTPSVSLAGLGGRLAIAGSGAETVNARDLAAGATLGVALGGGNDRFEGVFAKGGRLDGGAGDDVLDLDFSGSPVFVSGGLNSFSRYLNGVSESLQVTGFERLIVRAPDQGGSFWGGNGDDIFIGGASSDYFNPGQGFDLVDGGTGNDALVLDFNAAASGVTVALSSTGPDFTYTATSGGQVLTSGQATSIEQLYFTDTQFDDVLNGGDGNDYFNLTRGHDIVSGGAGYDGASIALYDNSSGINFVAQAAGTQEITYVAKSGGTTVSTGTLVSIETISITTTQYDDVINLPEAASVIAGYGNDVIYFRVFNGSYNAGAGDDRLALEGTGLAINLTSNLFGISGIERLDLTGSGDNNLILNDQNVINATDNRDSAFTAAPINDALVVLGDAGDVLDLRASGQSGSWIEEANGVGLDGSTSGDYRFLAYQLSGVTTAYIAVNSDVTVLGSRAPLPSILVTTGADEAAQTSDATAESADGEGLSLREALSTAAANALIVRFEASLAGQPLLLTNGPLTATTAPVTVQGDINGDGASDITVIADGATPAFVVNGGDLTLSNLTVETQEGTPTATLAGLGGRLAIAGSGAETVNARDLAAGATLDVALGGGDDRFEGVFAKGQLNGGAGDDVLDLDFSGSPVFVSGGLNSFSRYPNGVSESLQVTGFERLIVRAPDQGGSFWGGNGDDIFIGGAGYDYFDPGRGFDSVDGGAGNDTLGLSFYTATSGVTVALTSSGPDFTYTATSGGQTLASGQATSIEQLYFTDTQFDDVLNGGDGRDSFTLSRGNDIVNGGAGFDQIFYSFNSNGNGVNFTTQATGAEEFTYVATSGGAIVSSAILTSIESIVIFSSDYDDVIHLFKSAIVSANAGDDFVYISTFPQLSLGGGIGNDTLALDGAGIVINLLSGSTPYSFERYDLTGSGDNSLTLNDLNVINVTDTRDSAFTAAPINDALVVLGDAGDVLDLRASSPGGLWVEEANGVGLDGAAGGGFDFWAYTANGTVTAFLAVDSDVTVTTGGNAAADAFVAALQAQEVANYDAPLELTQDLLLPAFFDVDEPVAPYSPIHGDLTQVHIA